MFVRRITFALHVLFSEYSVFLLEIQCAFKYSWGSYGTRSRHEMRPVSLTRLCGLTGSNTRPRRCRGDRWALRIQVGESHELLTEVWHRNSGGVMEAKVEAWRRQERACGAIGRTVWPLQPKPGGESTLSVKHIHACVPTTVGEVTLVDQGGPRPRVAWSATSGAGRFLGTKDVEEERSDEGDS